MALLTATPAAALDLLLDADGIRSEIVGRPFAFRGHDGSRAVSGVILYREDGRILVREGDTLVEAGTWRTTERELCARDMDPPTAGETCFEIARLRGGRFVTNHDVILSPLDDGAAAQP